MKEKIRVYTEVPPEKRAKIKKRVTKDGECEDLGIALEMVNVLNEHGVRAFAVITNPLYKLNQILKGLGKKEK